jgi:hypothetical protein
VFVRSAIGARNVFSGVASVWAGGASAPELAAGRGPGAGLEIEDLLTSLGEYTYL